MRIRVSREQAKRLWFARQGLSTPRRTKITRGAFVRHLEQSGGLQLDSVNVLDRAHYLTLWSRFGAYERAEELLDFRYRLEIYLPQAKRVYGYYVMPILYNGSLVGRLDPKLHRDRGELEIRSIHYEPGFRETRSFRRALRETLEDLADFTGASSLVW